MKSFEGYLKKKLGDSYVLLAGGGHLLIDDLYNKVANLLKGSYKYTKSNPLTRTATRGDDYSYYTDLNFDAVAGETYVISCETDGNWVSHSGGSYGASAKACGFWLYSASDTHYSFGSNMPAVWTAPKTANYHVRINMYTNDNSYTLHFWNMKVERGRRATDWLICTDDPWWKALSADSVPWSGITSKPNLINTFGTKTGDITVRGGLTANGSVNLAMSGNQLQASIVGLGSRAFDSTAYLPLTGGTMSGILTLLGSQYNAYDTGNGALNLNNSDITGVNSILTADLSDTWKESIGFKRSNGNYDTFRAADGTFYFGVNNGTEYIALHSGNSSVSKSGETLTVKINDTSQSLTNTWRGIQNNLTSDSTTDSLSAALGKVLNDKFGSYLPLSGGTLTGNLSFSNSGTGFRGINYGTMGDNDQWRIGGAATGSNAGYMEIATADDGAEPIYVRQYTGVFSSLKRTATLLDGSGNTSFPGTVSASSFSGNVTGNCSGSAGSVAWANVTGKPDTFTPSSHTHSYLPLSGGTMVGTISASNDAYGGGGFNNGYANIILRGNTTTGTSGIVFSSSKGDTSINRPSDCAFIQFLPYGVSAATAVGTNPTINTSGEAGRFVIGIHNDSGDLLWLQTSAVNDLKHVVGANVYTIYDSGNLPAYPTKSSWNYDDRYVASLGTNGNYVTWTKNGATNNITIPYALNADKLDGWDNTKFCKVYTRAEIGETPNFDNLKDVDGNQVNGFFESRVNETTNATGKKPPYTSCAPMLSFLNQYVSLQLMGYSDEWYIRGGQSGNVANANANINWQRIVLNSGTWGISITGNAATASSVAWTNVTGRPTKITLTGSVTGSVSLGAGDLTLDTTTNHSHSWSSITSKPCTLISYGRNNENINANTWRVKECSLIEIRNTELTYSNLAMSGYNSFFNFWTPDGVVCTLFLIANNAFYYRSKLSGTAEITSSWYRLMDNNNCSVSKSGETLSVKINGTTLSLTNTWRGILDNLTSSANTTESLSAKQGYLLANGSARDDTKLPLSGGTITGTITISPTNLSARLKGLVLHDPGSGAGEASWIEWTSSSYSNGVRLVGAPDSKALYFWDTNSWKTIYHSGNLPAYPTKASWNYDDVYVKRTGDTISEYIHSSFANNEEKGFWITLTDQTFLIRFTFGSSSHNGGLYSPLLGWWCYLPNGATSNTNAIFTGKASYAGDADTLDSYHANTLFESLTRPSNTNDISIKIGNNTKSITLGSRAWDSTSYLPLAGGDMTGCIRRTYSSASDDPMISLASLDLDVWLWRVLDHYHLTSARYGYGLKYLGTGSGLSNALGLYVDNGTGTLERAVYMDNAGYISFLRTPTVGSTAVSLSNHNHTGTYVENVSINGDYLRIAKNGNTDLTIPYATSADDAKKLSAATSTSGISSVSFINSTFQYGIISSGSDTDITEWLDSYNLVVYLSIPWSGNTYGGQIMFGVNSGKVGYRTRHAGTWTSIKKFITSDNISSQSVSNADTVDSEHASAFVHITGSTMTGNLTVSGTYEPAIIVQKAGVATDKLLIESSGNHGLYTVDKGFWCYIDTSNNAYFKGNADTATTLQTTRSIWGLDFNGSGNISGNMSGVGTINTIFKVDSSAGSWATLNLVNYDPGMACTHLYVSSNNGSYTTTRPLTMLVGYGNVGIGTYSPGYKLEVVGTFNATSTISLNGTAVSLNGHKHSYTDLTGSGTTSNQAILSNGTANGWKLTTLGARAFDNTNYLPLSGGTLTNGSTSDGYILKINSGGGMSGLQFLRGGNTSWSIYVNGGNFYIHETHSNTIAMRWYESSLGFACYHYGNVYAPNYYTTSDRSKKTNISSFSEHIRKFQLKDTEKWHYGVIAQEVPEMFRDGEEGNMTVNYNSVLSYYVGQLENKVKMLEEKVRCLESQNK